MREPMTSCLRVLSFLTCAWAEEGRGGGRVLMRAFVLDVPVRGHACARACMCVDLGGV